MYCAVPVIDVTGVSSATGGVTPSMAVMLITISATAILTTTSLFPGVNLYPALNILMLTFSPFATVILEIPSLYTPVLPPVSVPLFAPVTIISSANSPLISLSK